MTPESQIDNYGYKIVRVMMSEQVIQQRVSELGEELAKLYHGKSPILVTLLKGGFIFLADLTRALRIPHEVDFMIVRSYDGQKSSGVVQIIQDLKLNIEGRHVVLVEDIVDTGLTLSFIRDHLMLRNPASLKICTLLDKTSARTVDVPLDLVGFPIADEFVVGYGLDYNQFYRNLPYIAILDPDQI